jgi:mannose-6-phosphate isomerase-like protein (cupin superfamily)
VTPAAFALAHDEGEKLVLGEVTILVRASSESTGGAFSLFEEVPPMVDTPSHVHAREDELFYVLEGEHVIEVGDQQFEARPGSLVFAPKGIPHAQRRVVPGEGRLLVMTTPGRLRRLLPRPRRSPRNRHPRAGRLRRRIRTPPHHVALTNRAAARPFRAATMSFESP